MVANLKSTLERCMVDQGYKAIVTTPHHNCLVLFPDNDAEDDDDNDDNIDVDDDGDNDDNDDDDDEDEDHLGGPQLKARLPSSEIVLSVRGTTGQTIFSSLFLDFSENGKFVR